MAAANHAPLDRITDSVDIDGRATIENVPDAKRGGAGDDILRGGAGDDLFILQRGQGQNQIYGGTGNDSTDSIELRGDGGDLGEYGVDWTISIESGEIQGFEKDGDASWLDLTLDASGVINMQDGSEYAFSGIDHIQW